MSRLTLNEKVAGSIPADGPPRGVPIWCRSLKARSSQGNGCPQDDPREFPIGRSLAPPWSLPGGGTLGPEDCGTESQPIEAPHHMSALALTVRSRPPNFPGRVCDINPAQLGPVRRAARTFDTFYLSRPPSAVENLSSC